MGTSDLQLIRSTDYKLDLLLVPEMGTVLWDSVCTLSDLRLFPGRQCQN